MSTLLNCLSVISTFQYLLPSVILTSWMQSRPIDWLLMYSICKSYEMSLSRLVYRRLLKSSCPTLSFLLACSFWWSQLPFWELFYALSQMSKTKRSFWSTVHEKQRPQSNKLWKSKTCQQSLDWAWKWTQSQLSLKMTTASANPLTQSWKRCRDRYPELDSWLKTITQENCEIINVTKCLGKALRLGVICYAEIEN